ncbi:helicase C-terminal domain-containing protein [Loigolactobacillus binensis]|uniref:3'-5' exonuclease DinG n=1 Tax=Loigolactobacillus binensis TaxID=2559922 RepID=A0ABW3ECX1_9LACO|nr:helicase C-terminal domain-containing protein [Loigolactobacillus binensis]
MNKDSIYAIVDLETTGTSVKNGDRIIQFGCALVQHGKIIDQIALDINPEREVPTNILQLTHLTTKRLKVAPYFEDVAGTIRQLLQDTIFVAHNVNFDYPFLDAELQRVGQPALGLAAIDTVELAQVLLPTAVSYRLSDLTQLLAIEHTNPHQADSDAVVTAQLFIALSQRLANLPLVTRQALAKCATRSARETGAFYTLYAQQDAAVLPDYLYVSHGLALRKKAVPATRLTTATREYPASDAAKKHYLQPLLKWRKTQGKMMDIIYTNYAQQPQPLILEAATGLGKSLGYLLPFSFRLQGQQQLVVSTSTAVLQTQFVQQTVPLLNQLLDIDLQAAIVKSPQHYIDLAKFSQALAVADKVKQVQLLKMQLLVWLTMTKTGDFAELHLTTYHSPLFAEINHHSHEVIAADNPFNADDFWLAARKQQQQADVLVTNHAFLSQHATDTNFFPTGSFLVVDEAQQFPAAALKASSQQLIGGAIMQVVKHLHKTLNGAEKQPTLASLLAADPVARYNVVSLDYGLNQFGQLLLQLQQQLFTDFIADQIPVEQRKGFIERALAPEELATWVETNYGAGQKLRRLLNDCLLLADKLRQRLLVEQASWLLSEQKLWLDFSQQVHQLLQVRHLLREVFAQLAQPSGGQLVWLTMKDYGDISSLTLQLSRLDITPLMQQLLTHFAPPVFTGATLTVGHKFDYFKRQMGLTDTAVVEKRFASPFRYKRQAAFFVVNDGPAIRGAADHAYTNYVARAVYQLTRDNQRQTLVLFNSLQMIAEVYRALLQTDLPLQREIFAQGMTGSKERITKRFSLSQRGILLGAGSFWEGIDLPKEALEQLVIARLPFAAPDGIVTKARYQQLTAAKMNPFFKEALPQATLRLRQGFGRLIRTSADYGVMVVLDDRIVTTSYGKRMLKTLPASLPKTTASLVEVAAATTEFFARKV